MMQLEERGYGTSTKKVCSCCVQNEYLKKLIRLNGEVGECDYCKDQKGRKVKTRKVVTVEKLMSFMMPAIRTYYQLAEYDTFDDEKTIFDPYDFVHEEIQRNIETPHDELLMELTDVLDFDD